MGNLQEYKFWRGGAEEIAKEYEWNKALGLKLDCWKSGVLVYDDDGKVADCIAERNIEVQRAISLEVLSQRNSSNVGTSNLLLRPNNCDWTLL